MLDQLTNYVAATNVANSLSPFNGDWTAQQQYIPIQAQIWDMDGNEILYPRMGMINKTTINGSVKGFKRSSNQLIGLSQADPKNAAKYEQDLQKLAYIANEFKLLKCNISKYDNSELYYQDGVMTIDSIDVPITMCIIISTTGNISFKIEERKDFNATKMAEAPELTSEGNAMLQAMLNAYGK